MAKKARKNNLSKKRARVYGNATSNENKALDNCELNGYKNPNGESISQSKRIDAINSIKSNKQITNGHEMDNKNLRLFPPYFQWIVFVLTLVFRLWYISQKTNWWILHPDEIFQTLEVAHSEIYGYGFRPYEYLPPPDLDNKNTTIAREIENQLGMYSLRSFLLPRMFAYIGYITISAGYSGGLFLVWKYFHVSVTSFLTIAVYLFAKTLSRSHDIAVVSAILSASSMFLNILGTHSIINSFTSPFVYLVMYYILENTSGKNDHIKIENSDHINVDTKDEEYDTKLLFSNYEHMYFQKHPEHNMLQWDHNGNLETMVAVDNSMDKREHCTHSNFFATVLSVTAMKACLVGVIFGILVYIRPDTMQVILLTILLFCRLTWSKQNIYLLFICGATLGMCLGLCEDYHSYGTFIVSPWQWFKFNIIGSSTRLFGLQPTLFYLKSLFLEDFLLKSLSILFCIGVLSNYFIIKATLRTKVVYKLVILVALMLLVFSLKGHKERRFVHDLIPLLLIIYSETIIMLCVLVKYQSKLILYSSLICIVSSQLRLFTTLDSNSLLKWTYNGIVNTSHVNICLDFISNQNDVTGVFLDRSIHMTGGYTILRHDVPIIALSHEEFLKFGKESRVEREPVVFNRGSVSVHTFSHFADFISAQNTGYLLKELISDKTFNYLVMNVERNVNVGYTEVFRYGKMRVLKRTFDVQSERALHSLVSNSRYSEDLQLIITEADWLIYYGAYDKAKTRLMLILKTNKSSLEAHQLLIQLYHIIGENKLARKALRNCTYYHIKEKCLQINDHSHKKKK